jgi:hypothetical protein
MTRLWTVLLGGSVPSAVQATPPGGRTGLGRLRGEAEALEPLVSSRLARDFLKGTRELPAIAPRTLLFDEPI